ncbi:MFS transporter [Corynebacterium sp. 320]|nr:MFS transporter [Corynebacterium sp. 320]KAB1551246.1 MFS transporter [Corynebacterium sp. 321]KAB1551926.1 MFS transporter [Corynebacterium sp. 319]KAB3526140.1 MFS transporter [Corynebacterium sp. 250]KAB3538920.1 MFS transporter [Corynebacterium sp. 366]QNP93176.1 MFS transporter [Corynebacterium zhongnanshanii]
MDERKPVIKELLKTPGLPATLVAVFCAFGGWSLLLPVIPLAIIDNGGSDSLAGLSTAVFMASTVITQAFTPWLLRTVGFRPVLMLSGLMLGLPAAMHLLSFEPWVVLAVAIVRGVGFGAVTVTEAALISELVPPELIGRSSGVYGLAVGSSQLLAFPAGLWVHSAFGDAVFWIAVIGAVVGAVAALGLPSIKASEREKRSSEGTSTWRLLLLPGVAIGAAATGFAAFSTFMAPATSAAISGVVLSVLGGMQMGSRLVAGTLADRVGYPGKALVPALVLCAAGVGVATWMIVNGQHSWALAILAAALFGSGFGAVQNEALLLMFHRLPRSKASVASAVWNMSFDSGTGAGALLLGVVATSFAYQGAFLASGLIIVLALGAAAFSKVGK